MKSGTGHPQLDPDDLAQKSCYKVVIKDLEASGLPKPDLIQKAKTWLEIHIAGNTFSTVEKKKGSHTLVRLTLPDTDPKWTDTFTFEFDSNKFPLSSEEKVILDVLDQGRGSLGYVMLDLPSVLTGPKQNKLTLRKKVGFFIILLNKKKRKCDPAPSDPLTKGMAHFTVDVACTSKATILIKDISFDRLKPALVPNPLFANYQNDVYMEYFLESQPGKYTTSVCYNTLSPTWEQCSISFEGTLKDILSQVVVFRVYHNNAVLELLGECKVPVKVYYSFNGASVSFISPLNVQNVPFGELKAFLQLKNLPCCAQVEGGYRCDEGVLDCQPLIEECPRPKLPDNLKSDFKAPLFALGKEDKPKPTKVDLPKGGADLHKTLKSLLEKLKKKVSSSTLDDFTNTLKKDTQTCAMLFRDDSVFLDFINLILANLGSKTVKKELLNALRIICTQDSVASNKLRAERTVVMLLRQLGEVKDDGTLKHLVSILELLSIADSRCQALFRKEESIHYLLKILGASKDTALNFQIIKILGNLAYGVGGGMPHNRDVIRDSGGVKKILKCLHPKLSSAQVQVMMDAIAVLSWENDTNGVEVVSTLVSMLHTKDDALAYLILQILDSILSSAGGATRSAVACVTSPSSGTTTTSTTATVSTTTTTMSSTPVETVLSRLFIDSASVTLINLQVVSKHKELISLAQALLRRYSYKGAEEKLLGELIQELWSTNLSSTQMAIETMAIWTKTNPASTKPLEEAVKTKGALEPLIQAVKKSVAPKSPKKKANSVPPPDDKLLLSSLQLIKRVTVDPAIASLVFNTEEQAFLILIIDLMNHSDPKIQKCSIELLNNLAKDKRADAIFSKSPLLERLLKIISGDTSVPLKMQALKLILHHITFADVERKKQFCALRGVKEIRKLLSDTHSQLATLSVKILHTICFPTVSEIGSVIKEIVKQEVVSLLVTLLSNPMLIAGPSEPPQPVVAEILAALKDFWSVEAIRSSVDTQVLISTVWKVHSLCYYCDVGQVAAECLKTWNVIAPCSVVEFGTKPITQLYAECRTCSLSGEEAVCWSCHKGHQINIPIPNQRKMFSCHCGGASGVCHSLTETPRDQAKPVTSCTFSFIGRKSKSQPAYQCSTCWSTPGKFICESCFKGPCHAGHLMQVTSCACGDRMAGCGLLNHKSDDGDSKGKSPETSSEPEKTKLDEADMDCIVCMSAKKDTIFYKCGHLACCYDCSLLMKGKDCPICRSNILDVCKVYHV